MELLGIKHYSESHHSNNFPNYIFSKTIFCRLQFPALLLSQLPWTSFLLGLFWAPTLCKEPRAQPRAVNGASRINCKVKSRGEGATMCRGRAGPQPQFKDGEAGWRGDVQGQRAPADRAGSWLRAHRWYLLDKQV